MQILHFADLANNKWSKSNLQIEISEIDPQKSQIP